MLPSIIAGLAGLLLPLPCVACGFPILRGGRESWPLCPSCRSGLRRPPGRSCPRCGLPLVSEEGACMACRAEPGVFDGASALFPFRGPAGSLIAACKFGNRPSLARLFAELLEPAIREAWAGHVVVPVPPRREARFLRGWDQVELVARELARRGLPVSRVLERAASLEQKTLGLEARRENARRAYRMRKGGVAPPRALLIDDVRTSGATAKACAEALRASGSVSVGFLALAAD